MKMVNFSLSGLGQFDEGDFLPAPEPLPSFDSGFPGDPGGVAGAPEPMSSTVYLPAGADPNQAIADQSVGMVPGETRRFVTSSGGEQKVVAVANEPAAPDLNTIYKIGTEIVRYVMQPQAGGGTKLVRQPVASSAKPSSGLWLLGIVGAAALLLRR